MPRGTLLLAAVLLLPAVGCATYTDRIETATRQVAAGDYRGAVDEMNAVLDVESADELPESWGGSSPLAVLERGVLLQALEDFEGSRRDLGAVDAELEVLDYTTDVGGQIGKYVYSDSAADYRATPSERLALHSVNMLNYLAQGDFAGAAVEARRFTVMREYLASAGLERPGRFGAYLAGLAFERLGEGDRALRYYEEAMAAGPLPGLRDPVRRLAAANPYRGPRIRALLGDAPLPAPGALPSEIVTVVCLGRVPKKVPERMPVGAAIGIAGTYITGNPDILARSVFKVVVYPELQPSASLARNAAVAVDGESFPADRVASPGADIRAEYQRLKPRILAAALTRMITRAAAAEGARYAGRQAGGGLGAIVGLLAALGTEAALVGLDRPDTRSWTLLADQVWIARRAVPPGRHRVQVTVTGPSLRVVREADVDVPPGRAAVVVVSEPR